MRQRKVVYYELYSDRTRSLTTQNCIAVLPRRVTGTPRYAKVVAFAPVIWQALHQTDCPVYETELLQSFLDAYCERIKEKKARKLHPHLVETVGKEQNEREPALVRSAKHATQDLLSRNVETS